SEANGEGNVQKRMAITTTISEQMAHGYCLCPRMVLENEFLNKVGLMGCKACTALALWGWFVEFLAAYRVDCAAVTGFVQYVIVIMRLAWILIASTKGENISVLAG
ncbi:hypothetical protein Tco_1415459, partial [Tanacetum coccineum]